MNFKDFSLGTVANVFLGVGAVLIVVAVVHYFTGSTTTTKAAAIAG